MRVGESKQINFYPIMGIIIAIFAAAFTAFTGAGAEASPLTSFHFPDLKVLTEMFVDCDTIIASDSDFPHNIYDVSQPVKVFNDWKEFQELTSHSYMYESDNFTNTMEYYHQSKVYFFRKELRGLNCRAQILVFYRSWKLENAHSLYALSGFRHDASTFRYTVVIHKADYRLKSSLFIWSALFPLLPTILHFYHVTMDCHNEGEAENFIDNSLSSRRNLIGMHYRGWPTCVLHSFDKACIWCKMHDFVEYPCNRRHQTECPVKIAQESHKEGSIAANERHLAVVRDNEYIQMHGLKLVLGTKEMYKSNRWVNFRDFITSVQRQSGRHAVVTRLDELIFPEEIFLHSVLTHHENVTLKFGRLHSTPIVAGEVIIGPGLTNYDSFGGMAHSVPVGIAGISFMTCSNISFAPQVGIFFSPLDGATWMWALTSLIAVSVTLLMTIKRMKVAPALVLTMYTMVRLVLDNHGSVSRAVMRRGKVMGSLTFLMALATIILNTGYKGVLTSDFAKPPQIAAAPTFEQVLDSDWSVIRHTSVTFPKTQNLSFQSEAVMHRKIDKFLADWRYIKDLTEKHHFFNYTENGLKEYQLVSKAIGKLRRNMDQLRNEPKGTSDIIDQCHCNGSYWIFETGTFRQPKFPKGCKNVTDDQQLLLSKERIAKTSISWDTLGLRPGPVFTSIHRAIEAGLYKWLNNVRSISNFGVYVKGQMMTRLLKKEPKPLSMKTVLVSSTFRLQIVLSLITLTVLVVEILWFRKKQIYFALRRRILNFKFRRLWEVICEAVERLLKMAVSCK